MSDEFVAYCIEEGCGEQATVERPWGLTEDGDEIVELVCPAHATYNEFWRWWIGS